MENKKRTIEYLLCIIFIICSDRVFGQRSYDFIFGGQTRNNICRLDNLTDDSSFLHGQHINGGISIKTTTESYFASNDTLLEEDIGQGTILNRSKIQIDNHGYREIEIRQAPTIFSISQFQFKGAYFEGGDYGISLTNSSGNTFSLYRCDLGSKNRKLIFDYAGLDSIDIQRSRISAISFDGLMCKGFAFFGDTITQEINFGYYLPNTITLEHLELSPGAMIDLTGVDYHISRRCQLTTQFFDISRLKLNYALFDLCFFSNAALDEKESQYKQLLDNQYLAGYKEGYQKADIEFQKLENSKKGLWGIFLNCMEGWWNNFGYNKEYIFRNACIIFLLVFLINLFCYHSLVDRAYTIAAFKDANRKITILTTGKKKALTAYYCLLYTGIVFWGLKISIDKIKISSGRFAAWIIFQYIVGLVILGFVANVVLGK